ncbi:hypothetical protein ATCCBAA256_09540 [Mycobacterium montefiorense]|nr:hypothetical protein ATCCBAA256_09540 [Mycobacterium montefiorense]
MIDSAGHVGKQVGVTVSDACHEQADFHAVGNLAPTGQRSPTFEVIDIGLAVIKYRSSVNGSTEGRRVEMVVTEDQVGADTLCEKYCGAP